MNAISFTALDEQVYTSEEPLFRMMRYLMSDKVAPHLQMSLDADQTPVIYTERVTRRHWKEIYKHFHMDSKLPFPMDNFQKGWVYDQILQASLYYRIAQVRPKKVEDVLSLIQVTIPGKYLFQFNSPSLSKFAGLSDFNTVMRTTLNHIAGHSIFKILHLLRRLAKVVGDSDMQSWICRRPIWDKLLHSNDEFLRVFRGFLYVCLIYAIEGENFPEEAFEVTRYRLEKDILTLICLCEDENTTRIDILGFLNDVEGYSLDINPRQTDSVLYRTSFEHFKQLHFHMFGNHYDFDGTQVDKPIDDHPEWIILRTLGEEGIPENVVQTMMVPHEFVSKVLDKYYKTNYEDTLVPFCRSRNITIPEKFPDNGFLVKSTIADHLFCSAVTRRTMAFYEIDYEQAKEFVYRTAHILLILNHESEYYGLSLVESLITYRLENTSELSEEERWIMEDFISTWRSLRLDRANRIPKRFKKALKDKEFRSRLRTIAFFALESISIPRVASCTEFFGMSRKEVFQFVETASTYLRSFRSTDIDTPIDYLNAPDIYDVYTIDESTHGLWNMPFSMITQTNIHEETDDE